MNKINGTVLTTREIFNQTHDQAIFVGRFEHECGNLPLSQCIVFATLMPYSKPLLRTAGREASLATLKLSEARAKLPQMLETLDILPARTGRWGADAAWRPERPGSEPRLRSP